MATDQNNGTSMKTKDPDTIMKWVEERGGHPATVASTAKDGEVGLLQIDFDVPGSGQKDDDLRQITWDEFFDKMKEKNLAFVYEDKTDDGLISRYFKFVYDEGKE